MRNDDPFGPRTERDRGSALPLALVMSVILAIVAIAIAGYAATALRSTNTTTARVDRLADADAGMRSALIALEATDSCPTGPLTGDFNRSNVTIENCEEELVADPNAGTQFGLVITGRHPAGEVAVKGTNLSQPRTAIEIGGPIYLGPDVRGNTSKTDFIALDTVATQRTSCADYEPDNLDWIGKEPDGAEGAEPICTQLNWYDVSPPPLPLTLPTSAAPAPSLSGQCRVFQPGIYNPPASPPNRPAIQTDETNAGPGNQPPRGNYFKSGVYIVTGPISLAGDVTMGHPNGVDQPTIGTTGPNRSCRQAQQNDIDDGGPGGVILVLVGSARFEFPNQTGRVDMYGHPVGPTGARLVSVAAFPPPPDAAPEMPQSLRGPSEAILISNPTANFTVHGEFWAPNGWVDLENLSSWQAGNGFQGGLTIAVTDYRVTGGAGNSLQIIGNGGIEATYRYRIVVAATDNSGGVTRVSTISRPLPGGLIVDSWRVL